MTTGVVAQGCPVHEGFDPLSPQYLDDPFAVMAALPLEEPPAECVGFRGFFTGSGLLV